MTKEEIRDYVEKQRNLGIIPYHVYSTLIDGIDTLEQETCEDNISRDDALKALAYNIKSFEFKSGVGKHINEIAKLLNTIYEIQSNNIKALPPVQPKTGHWIYEKRKRLINETDEGAEYVTDYWCKCSRCGGDFGYRKMKDAFCKYCGARIVEPQAESEGKK